MVKFVLYQVWMLEISIRRKERHGIEQPGRCLEFGRLQVVGDDKSLQKFGLLFPVVEHRLPIISLTITRDQKYAKVIISKLIYFNHMLGVMIFY